MLIMIPLYCQKSVCGYHVWLFETPWTIACQALLSMDVSRQECWSGLQFPTPGDLPDPGIDPGAVASPALAGGFFTTVPCGKLCIVGSIAQMPTFLGTSFQLTWSILQLKKKKPVVYSVCSIPLIFITFFIYVVRSVMYLSLI